MLCSCLSSGTDFLYQKDVALEYPGDSEEVQKIDQNTAASWMLCIYYTENVLPTYISHCNTIFCNV